MWSRALFRRVGPGTATATAAPHSHLHLHCRLSPIHAHAHARVSSLPVPACFCPCRTNSTSTSAATISTSTSTSIPTSSSSVVPNPPAPSTAPHVDINLNIDIPPDGTSPSSSTPIVPAPPPHPHSHNHDFNSHPHPHPPHAHPHPTLSQLDRDIPIQSIIKVYATVSSPNYSLPWQNGSLREVTGSGFVIDGERILTNAHVIADQKYVMVRKLGSPIKYQAQVSSAGHECDLAVLRVDDPTFWVGLKALQWGDIPDLEDEVSVIGYPIGGDNVSVTRGVVSRIEPQQYAHGAANLLAIQIDAAINPGNSGGPALQSDRVIGVAFQNLSGANNIGFIIPIPIIQHFLYDVTINKGKYKGFCSLGISCQPTENRYLQQFLGMSSRDGIVVNRIERTGPSYGILQKNDVIVGIDGVTIACDGTVPFRGRERIAFDYLVSSKFPGDAMRLDILRGGIPRVVTVNVAPVSPLVPYFGYDQTPSYLICAGLVFTPLTQPYLHEHGANWYNTAPRILCDLAINGTKKYPGEQVVILSQVLMSSVNVGYQPMIDVQVKRVNGQAILNLKHLSQIIHTYIKQAQLQQQQQDNNTQQPSASDSVSASASSRPTLTFDMSDDRIIVLDIWAALSAHDALLQLHRIPSDRSPDLLHDEGDIIQFTPNESNNNTRWG